MSTPFLSDYLKVVAETIDVPADPTTDPGTSPEMIAFCFDAETQTLSMWDPVNEERLTVSFGGTSLTDTDDLAEGVTNLYFTEERAQDAVGNIFVDGTTVNFAYNDGVPSITAEVQNIAVSHFAANVVDDDDTLAADSSTRIPTQAAVKGYVDANSGAGAPVLLATASPTGTATVTVNPVTAGYTALRIIGQGRSTTAGTGAAVISLRFNNDSGANYRKQSTIGNGTGSAGDNQGTADTGIFVAELPRDGNVADTPGAFDILIPFYDQTTYAKYAQSHYGFFLDNAATGFHDIMVSGMWLNTAAITRLDFILASGNYKAGTEFRVYGIP